jgi:hypothetical protein
MEKNGTGRFLVEDPSNSLYVITAERVGGNGNGDVP